jgi:hypothetical protein
VIYLSPILLRFRIPHIDDSLPYVDKSSICNQLVKVLDDPDKCRDFLARRGREAQLTLNKLQAVIVSTYVCPTAEDVLLDR